MKWLKISEHPMPKEGRFIVGRKSDDGETFMWAEVFWGSRIFGPVVLVHRKWPIDFEPTHWFRPCEPNQDA